MPATPDDLFRRLDDLGIATRTVEHPPLFTVAESKTLRGQLPGGHCKSLFLRDKKKRSFLVVTLEDHPVDLAGLPDRIGAGRLSFGSPERLMEYLGVIPGSVTPFALINDPDRRVEVVLEAAMLQHDPLNYHPLVNTMTTAISPADLLAFIKSCGHDPRVLPL
jgi:Ala-tRNA(Pro) deacylase